MKTKTITMGGITAALALVLSFIKLFDMPYGGSVTAASMVPVIFFSLTSDFKSSFWQSMVYALLQLILGFYAPPAKTFISYAAVVFLDYVAAFGVLSLAGPIARKFKDFRLGSTVAAAAVVAMRFVCHFASGILIWASLAPEGQSVWLYSLVYNGGYMLGELVITTAVTLLLSTTVKVSK